VAAFDLVTFALGGLLGWAAWMLHKKKAKAAAKKAAPAAAPKKPSPAALGDTPAQEGA
jgi:hypothetical protein